MSDDPVSWVKRWRLVRDAELTELRTATPEMKLRQLEALRRSSPMFDWSSTDRENEHVQRLWIELRRRSGIS